MTLRKCDCGGIPVLRDYWHGQFCIVSCPDCGAHTYSGNEDWVVRHWNRGDVHGESPEHVGYTKEQMGYEK